MLKLRQCWGTCLTTSPISVPTLASYDSRPGSSDHGSCSPVVAWPTPRSCSTFCPPPGREYRGSTLSVTCWPASLFCWGLDQPWSSRRILYSHRQTVVTSEMSQLSLLFPSSALHWTKFSGKKTKRMSIIFSWKDMKDWKISKHFFALRR